MADTEIYQEHISGVGYVAIGIVHSNGSKQFQFDVPIDSRSHAPEKIMISPYKEEGETRGSCVAVLASCEGTARKYLRAVAENREFKAVRRKDLQDQARGIKW